MRGKIYINEAKGHKLQLWPMGKQLLLVFTFLMFALTGYTQSRTISGRITDSETGEAIPGAAVMVKGTSSGTVTDFDGKYSFDVSEGSMLVVSFVGYISEEVTVGNQSVIDVALVMDITALEEVVVLGYGQEQNAAKVSMAVNSIDKKTIESIKTGQGRAELVLQGTTPGVVVQQNSGSPGSPLTIRVRGVATAGGAQPLYLVDGMQVPNLNFLNSSDIENITVLKDAAAAAIYGARGGNGVILVETKKGKRGVDKPTITLESYYGVQNLARKPDLMNKDQYIKYYNEYQNSLFDKDGNPIGKPFTDKQIAILPNTDWYDEVFDKNQPIQNYNLSVSNGGEKYTYYVSGGIFDQNGMIGGEKGKSNFNRKNLRAYFDADLLDNLKVRVGTDFVRNERNYIFENSAATGTSVMNFVNSIPAIYPAFDANGDPVNVGNQQNVPVVGPNGDTVFLPGVGAAANPHLALLLNNNKAISDIRKYDFAATWTPIENLDITGTYAYYKDYTFDKQFYPAFDYTATQNIANPNASLNEITYESTYSQVEGSAKYKFTNLGGHNLEVLGGFSVLQQDFSTVLKQGTGFLVNDFETVNFAFIKDATKITNNNPIASETGLLSYFTRASYDYKEKYLLSTSFRADASSRFGKSNRTGYFPAVSTGWVVSKEDFMSGMDFVDLLKLRASWGINGIDNLNDYQYSTRVSTGTGPTFGGNNTSGISIGDLANPNVKWEQIVQTDIGLDANLLNNTLGITLDYYNKLTQDMLAPIGTPVYTGYTSAATNIADVRNKGIEFMLTYKKTYSNDFSWHVNLNVGHNVNKVESLGDNGQPLSGGNIGFIFPGPITRTDVGHPIASFYGYKVDSISPSGKIVFKNLDKEGGITEKDRTFLGSPYPSYTSGLTLGASYMGFDINTFIFGSFGNKIYNATNRLDAAWSNRSTNYLDADAPKNVLGLGATDPNADALDQLAISDFYIQDGSFVKLRNLTVGYSLPKSLIDRAGLSKVRFYVTGQNLLIITNYTGIDPEIGQAQSKSARNSNANSLLDVGIDRGFYPQPRTVLFGAQISF